MSNDHRPLLIKPLNAPASIVHDDFDVIAADQPVPDTGCILVHLDAWVANQTALQARAEKGELGVYLNPDDNPELLAPHCNTLKLIAFHFTAFKFGQGYSGAVLLRTRHGFQGEIRAFGDVGRDQLYYLARCGFTQFKLKEGKSIEDALAGFNDFSTPYQSSADGQLPIFTRRTA